MIPSRHTQDVVAAERALSRLDALSGGDAARQRRRRIDAMRRQALALAKLDGWLVDLDDLVLALASPGDVDAPRRRDAVRAAGVYQLLRRVHDGLVPEVMTVGPDVDLRIRSGALREALRAADLGPGTREAALAALDDEDAQIARARGEVGLTGRNLGDEIRRLKAESRSMIDELLEAAQALDGDAELAEREAGIDGPSPLRPWSPAWVEEIWLAHNVAIAGARPAPFGDAELAIVEATLGMIDQALRAGGGVVAAARALHRLQYAEELPAPPDVTVAQDAPEEVRAAARAVELTRAARGCWWPTFGRLVAPQLLARACRLEQLWMPVAVGWAADIGTYRAGLAMSEDDWVGVFARSVVATASKEEIRWATVDRCHEGWSDAIATVRAPNVRRVGRSPSPARPRRSNSRLPEALDLLHEQPAISARQVQERLRCSLRGAHDLLNELVRAGVLRPAVERGTDRVWKADVR